MQINLIIDCDLFTKLIICLAQLPFAHFAVLFKRNVLHFMLKKAAVIYQIAVSYLISIFHRVA